jgi:hypothetical protein
MNYRRSFLPEVSLLLLLISVLSWCIFLRGDPGKSNIPKELQYVMLATKLQSYRIENGNEFSNTLKKLDIDLPLETNNYIY